MSSRAHYDAARTRLIVDIHFALQEQNFVKARDTLQIALSDYPDDTTLKAIQRQLFQDEQTANIAVTLFRHGCRKIQCRDYEVGIEKLRHARQLSPLNREIQTALFDALTEFAKIVVDSDPDRARKLLHEAARISPLNLGIERIGTYLAGRVRQRKVDECLMKVEQLRSNGQYREALNQVIVLETQIRAFPAPALERAKQELLWDLATKSAPVQPHPITPQRTPATVREFKPRPRAIASEPPERVAVRLSKPITAVLSSEIGFAAVASAPVLTSPAATEDDGIKAKRKTADLMFRNAYTHMQETVRAMQQSTVSSTQSFAESLNVGMRNRWNRVNTRLGGSARRLTTAIGSIQIRRPLHSLSRASGKYVAHHVAPLMNAFQNLVRTGWNHARSRSMDLPKAHPLATGVTCLALVFAAVTIGRPAATRPVLNVVGTGKLMLPVTLFRKPAADSGIAGSLKSGEPVELLQQIPTESLDSWTLIRPADRKGTAGYVRLRNLDDIRTADSQFNLWYALSFLNRSTSSREFRERLATLEEMLSLRPAAAFREDDHTNLTVSKAFARLAAETTNDPELARRDLDKAETYLMRIPSTAGNSREIEVLKWSIQTTRAVRTDH